jgi:hypothetical protein
MYADDDTKYWGLFENRPAKERTSAPAGDRQGKRTTNAEECLSRRRRPLRSRTETEQVKC